MRGTRERLCMMRRGWARTIGAMICLSLEAGCSHTLVPVIPHENVQSASVPTPKLPEQQPNSNAASPYHALRNVPEANVAQATEVQVERGRFPVPPRSPELVPEPVPPANPTRTPPVEAAVSTKSASEDARPKPADDPPLVASLRYFMNKQPAEAVACLRSYGKPAQDLLLSLLPLVARLTERDEFRDPQEVAALMEQLGQARDSLRPLAALRIEKMCLVSSIQRFGVYLALPDDQALHSGDFLQVYAELQNFSIRQDGSLYAIPLRSKIEIRDFSGKKCWSHDYRDADKPDVSTSPRHDFFMNYQFYIPPLPPGPYTLRLQVTDVPTQRTATRTLDFRIAPARQNQS